MFDPGSMLILFALALMMVSPIHVTIVRPRSGITHIAPMQSDPFPRPIPVPGLDELVHRANEALANDPLIRATAAVAGACDQA